MKQTVFSIDIGGSFIKCGLVCKEGKLLKYEKIKTPGAYGEILKEIDRIYKNMGHSSEGAAVAVPGGYDFKKGMAFAPNLQIINGRNIKKDIENITRKPTVAENDANLAALGEYVFVEKKNTADMVLITLGTGVGGGLILNGKLFSKDVTAFEVGHISVTASGRKCECGRKGCLDEYCSVGGLQKIYEKISGIKNADPKELGKAARLKDPAALKTFDSYGRTLSGALVNLANLLAPDKIKLGGGLSELGEYFLPGCIREFEKHLFPLYRGRTAVETAKMKNDAGMLGGAALFFDL